MASVNKQSLREEFAALKGRFGGLCAEGKVSAESRALFEALLMLLQVLMAVFMEKNTPKTSANSSKPSSQTPKDETALTRPGTQTKGKAFDPSRSANTRTVQTIEVSKVGCCENCGEDLRKVPSQGHERRTQIDIVFEKVVMHVDAEIKSCPHCGQKTRGPDPAAHELLPVTEHPRRPAARQGQLVLVSTRGVFYILGRVHENVHDDHVGS